MSCDVSAFLDAPFCRIHDCGQVENVKYSAVPGLEVCSSTATRLNLCYFTQVKNMFLVPGPKDLN